MSLPRRAAGSDEANLACFGRSAKQPVVVAVTFYFSLWACGFQVSGSRRFAGGNGACEVSGTQVTRRQPPAAGRGIPANGVRRQRCSVPRAVLAARRARQHCANAGRLRLSWTQQSEHAARRTRYAAHPAKYRIRGARFSAGSSCVRGSRQSREWTARRCGSVRCCSSLP